MKIGLPRALVFYYFYPLWKTFFESMGMEVVISDKTSVNLLHRGTKFAVPEICVPIKVFTGHVQDLLEKDVDYIFIPRLVNVEEEGTFCPKFLGLPEMMEYTIPELNNKILAPQIHASTEAMDNPRDYKCLIELLGVKWKDIKAAIRSASEVWMRFRQYCLNGYTVEEASDLALGLTDEETLQDGQIKDVRIGVLGYVYNIYDPLIGMNIVKKIRNMGAQIETFEMVEDKIIKTSTHSMSKPLFWTFSNKLWGAAEHFYNREDIDGLIHVTAFGCGPDSLLGKMIELDSNKYRKPFMTIRVDEHTGESHLDTRIEAFIDMIRRKKYMAAKGAGA